MEFEVRNISENDMDKVIDMLQDISTYYPQRSQFQEIFKEFNSQNNVFGFVFFYDEAIIGYGSLIVETKIRGGRLAHIEDIVVDKGYRNQNFGVRIIEHLITVSKNRGCYKVSLVCQKHNVGFYERCGLNVDGVSMSLLSI